jgi:hypothetical protein
MLIQITESRLISWRSRLWLIAMSISLKLSYIALKLTLHPWTTGLSSESKSKQYALELAETGSLGRALNLAGYFAKTKPSAKKAIETTKPALAEFIKEQRPNDPEPIVWDVSQIAKELGAEIIDEIPLCSGGDGPMVLKTGTKEGKEYRGWVCPTPKSGHPAKWMRVGSDGHWVFQK